MITICVVERDLRHYILKYEYLTWDLFQPGNEVLGVLKTVEFLDGRGTV